MPVFGFGGDYGGELSADRHGEPVTVPNLSPSARFPNPSPSEPVALSPRRTGTPQERAARFGRARTRPNGGNARAGGCGAFGANPSADYQNGEPARTRRKIGTPRTCHRRRGFRTRDGCPVGRSDAGRFSKPYGNLTKSGARAIQGRGGCFSTLQNPSKRRHFRRKS